MKAQAELMKRQADLTQAQFDQWVDLENWRIDKRGQLIASVDLVNHTAYPVTLDEGYITVADAAGTPRRTYLIGEKTFLSPNQPHAITIDVSSGMTPQQVDTLWGPLSFSVTGMFSHRHRITKETITQTLDGMLECGHWKVDHKWHASYTPFVHMNPERTEADGAGEQKAN